MHAHLQTQSPMGAQAQWSITTTPCQRECKPRVLQQHSAKGNANPKVFHNTMPKGTPTHWSFTTQCQREYRPNGLLQHNAKEHQP
jgi:hypothetical protein